MSTVPLNLNGYTELPAGKLAFVVTSLEMLRKPDGVGVKARSDVTLEPWFVPDLNEYRNLFREIGEDWLWFERLVIDDEVLQRLFAESSRFLFAPCVDGKRVGMLEIDYSDPESPEIDYFGLIPSVIGSGMGRWLMAQAIAMAWSKAETKRLWLHTCTGDSPQALGFYRACGFEPFKLSLEVVDDPRSSGHLPKDKGARVPYVERASTS